MAVISSDGCEKEEKTEIEEPYPGGSPADHVPSSSKSVQASPEFTSLRVSLPITEDIIKSIEELRKMIVITMITVNASVNSLAEALSEMLNVVLGNITPYENHFILAMSSTRSVTFVNTLKIQRRKLVKKQRETKEKQLQTLLFH